MYLIKYLYNKFITNNKKLKGLKERLQIFFNIEKFLILPQSRFIISIHLRVIFLLFKLWYLFNIIRGFKLIKNKKKNYLHILYLIGKKIIIKLKLNLFRERYKSKCKRFVLRQLNFRFSIIRYTYRKYYLIKYYIVEQLPYFISYYFYINYYNKVDIIYLILVLFYIAIVFVLVVFSGFMFIVLGFIASDKYFYNINAWINI